MLLGLSGQENEAEIDLAAVSGGIDGGVRGGTELTAFVDASVARDAEALASARQALAGAIGTAAMVDAAAVCANFFMMTRVADGTGTPLDAGSVEPTAGIRSQIGVDRFVSRREAATTD